MRAAISRDLKGSRSSDEGGKGGRAGLRRCQLFSPNFDERNTEETSNSEWKRNKVLAWTKSERDGRIIPVLLTAPPQSVRPAFRLFHPPPYPSPLSPPVPSTHATSSLSFVSSLGYGMPFASTSVSLFFFPPSSRRSYRASTLTAYATFFFSSFALVRARTSVLGLPLERKRMATQRRDFSRNRTTTIETRVGKLRAKKEFHFYLPSFISGYGTM